MDGFIQSEQNVNKYVFPGKKGARNALLLEVILITVILILLLLTLNYFNILPISKLLPSQKSQSTSAIAENNIPSTPLKILCPTAKEFCQIENGVIKDGNYIGWGSVLASGSAIFAAFDGVLSSTESTFPKEEDNQTTQKKFITAYLDSSELGLRGTYYFRGSITKSGQVAKGEQIGISNGKVIAIYDNKSLIFSLISGYPKTNNPIILNKENFTL